MKEILNKIINSLYSDENYPKEYSNIYKIHKYWARKPWYIVEKYINEYSNQNDTVMDPFCGSGCTGLEAVINNRNFIGRDLNPSAIQVSSGTLINNIDFEALEKDLKMITKACKESIMNLYTTEYVCPKCGKHLYYKYINIGPKFENNYSGRIYCDNCKSKGIKHELTKTEVQDLKNYKNLNIEKWVPKKSFPKKFYKDRFSYKGISLVTDMYTKRNLYALSLLYDEIQKLKGKNKELFLLAFTNTVLHVSKLKSENVRPLGVNNYWIPDDYIEENVWYRFEDRIENIIKAKKQQYKRELEKKSHNINYGSWSIDNVSALDNIEENSIDYFFTDPPYGDAIQYSELSYIWNAWLDKTYNTKEEVIINPVQNKGKQEFNELLSKSLENIYGALKPNKYFTLCFQNKNSEIWKSVILKCRDLGFTLVDISIYDTYGSPYNKSWANFSPKSDIYVTFQKSDILKDNFYSKKETIEDIIYEINSYMKDNNISENNNRLYDLTISYLLWGLYYNKQDIDVKKFDVKCFSEMAKNNVCQKQLQLL